MRINLYRRGTCALLAAALACSAVVPMAQAAPNEAGAKGAEAISTFNNETGLIQTTIPHTRVEPEGVTLDGNHFTFSPNGGWAFGSDPEHVWSKTPANAQEAARDLWYEVEFDGTSIEIFAGRNKPMGKVKYVVDPDLPNPEQRTYTRSLYNPTNEKCVSIVTIPNLSDGKHVLRAEATGAKDDAATGYTMDCAKVVVTHTPYEAESLELDADTLGYDTDETGAHLDLDEDATTDLQFVVEPDYVSDQDLEFSSDNQEVATVDANGVVTAVGAGSANITVASKAEASTAEDIVIPVNVTSEPLFEGKLDGFISDVDTQWTQDRFDEALNEVKENDQAGKKKDAKAASTADDTAELSAWKNDAAISEITLAAGEDVTDVTLEATNFTAAGGKTIEAKNVELSFIGSTKAYNGEFLGYGNQPAKYPAPTDTNRSESNDILLGDSPVSVDRGKLQNVFVKVNVPKDAQPGDYTGTVKVNAKGLDNPLEFTYALKVQDAELPDVAEFGKTFDAELWQYPYTSAEYYGVEPFSAEHFEVLKPIMELYKSIGGHAITTTIIEEAWNGQTYADPDADGGHDDKIHYPSMIKWQLDENGVMTYDFTNFDKWVEFNQKLGIGDKIVLYSIAPWHNGIMYYDAEGNLQTVADNQNGTVGESEGNKYWRHFLEALVDHLEDKGWFDMAYMAIDERGITHAAFDMVESVKNSKGESLKTAGAMDKIVGSDRVALAMRIDDLNIGDFAAQQAEGGYDDLLKKRSEAGLRTTLYSCTEHYPGNFSLSNPVESYWSIINAEKDGNTSGFLRWAYDAWVDDPLNDATHWSFEAGDCFLIYPGADKATVEKKGFKGLSKEEKTAKSSIRLERMAEGIRDANKIKKMRSEVTDMTDDIQNVYNKITRVANKKTNRDWTKVDEEMASLDAEMSQFKLDLVTLTDQYIKERSGAPTTLTITGADTVEVGATTKLEVTSDTASRGVVWTASNPDIAVVSSDGTVTGIKPGVCDITATAKLNNKVVSEPKTIVVTAEAPEIPQVDVSAAQVAHYDFEGDAENDWGVDAARAAGDSLDGTENGELSYESGRDGKGVHVNAAEGKTVSLPDDAFGLDGAKAWTVGYWVKSLGPMSGQMLPLIDEDSNYAFAMRLADDRPDPGLRVGTAGGDVLTFGGINFKKDTWYRIVWTNDPASGLSMWVDGKKIGNTNDWTSKPANKNNIKVPIDVIGGNGFNGIVDELAIYNRVLTEDEIVAQKHEFTGESEGLGLETNEKVIYEDESFGISGEFGSDVKFEVVEDENEWIAEDEKLEDNDIVTVTDDGKVTGELRGTATVKVTSGGKSEEIEVTVKRYIAASNNLTPVLVDQSEGAGYISDIYDPRDDGNFEAGKKYYGQPDMVRTRTGRLITAFPQGHGHGPLFMRYSDDEGKTWNEFSKPLPEDWTGSQETPTMYCLDMPDGSERIIMITACPGWGTDNDGNSTGWNTSYSDDNGETWTEYKHWYSTFENGTPNKAIVGMASLIQLRDPETGKPIHRWMGVYHDYGYVNYKTYLTFDEDGNEHWTEPEPYLSEHRAIESRYQMCEIGMFRSPDGKTIVGLARSQSHNNPSTLIMSHDEGETWTEPMDLPGSLAGERHKAMYDPLTGKLIITFREIQYDLNYNNSFDGNNDWICNSWGMWVGTYNQLINQEEGEQRFRLSEDWTRNPKKGDTGYTGLTVNPETGVFVMDSYGHWDRAVSEAFEPYDVKKDLSYIRQAKFRLNGLLGHEGFKPHDESERISVTFDFGYETEDGVTFTDVEWTNEGTVVAQPADPVRPGYYFTGWFVEEVGASLFGAKKPYDFKTPLPDGTKLVAGWEKNPDPAPFEIFAKFHLNYDGAPNMDPVKVVDGKVSAPAEPTRDGYAFEGWFTDKACEKKFDFNTKVTENIALYAKWTRNDKPVDPEPGKPDKSALGQLIGDAEQAKTDGKSDKVVAEFKDALVNAVAVFEKEDATEDEIKAAFDRLSDALTALENDKGDGGNAPVDPDKPTDPEDPADPNKPTDPNKPGDPDKNDPAKPNGGSKPNGGGKPGGGLPGTGDDTLLYVGGAAAAGVAVLAGGVVLARKRKDR